LVEYSKQILSATGSDPQKYHNFCLSAVQIIQKKGNETEIKEIIRIIDVMDHPSRYVSALLWSQIRGNEAIKPLIEIWTQNSIDSKGAISAFTGKIIRDRLIEFGSESENAIFELLNHPNRNVREDAIGLILGMKNQHSLQKLKPLLNDPDEKVQDKAIFAFGLMGDKSVRI